MKTNPESKRKAVLDYLRLKKPVSGQELGNAIGVTRSAIWKYIKELREEGYQIDSVPSKGYYFLSSPDRLLPEEVIAGLDTRILGREIIYRQEVTSTQEIARQAAARQAGEGLLVVSEVQKGGRGRVGRVWASLPGSVYFSIILRPDIKPTEALRVPLVAGIAVARTINRQTGLETRLKWPNDIFINNRKAGGILTELSAEVDRLEWIIIGIGLNVNATIDSMPDHLRETATSIRIEFGEEISRVKLLQQILMELESLYDEYTKHGFEPLRKTWKEMSNTIGAEVIVRSINEEITGKAVDIDSDGALILEKANGKRERIVAGDVSVRRV
mgnify:CR=1 FL=1